MGRQGRPVGVRARAHMPVAPCLYNYSADAGHGSATFTHGEQTSSAARWRAALLGTVAAGALMFGYGRTARAQIVPPAAPCDVVSGGGTTVTCSGDLGAGVANGYAILNVNNLTANIAPAAGVSGISSVANTPTLNSDTGPFAIFTTGAGVGVRVGGNPNAATLNHTGDVTSAGAQGIYATSTAGNATIVSSGTVNASTAGIDAFARTGGGGAGNASVTHTGDVTSITNRGISARTGGTGTATVVSTGTINAVLEAIYAAGTLAVNVTQTGPVTSTNNRGIEATSTTGAVTVISTGAINASLEGIFANSPTGNVTVTSTGDVTSTNQEGIDATSQNGNVSVTSTGNISAINSIGIRAVSNPGFAGGTASVNSTGKITASLQGILAQAREAVSVTQTGDVTSTTSVGIYALSTLSTLNSITSGTINAFISGITAIGDQAVSVTHTGDVTSTTGRCITAGSVNGTASLNFNGTCNAAIQGLYAAGPQAVNVTTSGSVTSTATGVDARSTASSVSLTNSGFIIGGNGIAINIVSATGATLNLNAGSNIQGAINLGAGPNVLNVGNGLSIANTFGGAAPVIGTTNGAPFAILGQQVAVVDPTTLSVPDEVIADLTGGISSSVLNRLGSLRNGVAGVTTNPRPMYLASPKDGYVAERAREYWVQGFGSYREQDGDGPSADTEHRVGGIVSGMDAQYTANTRAGFFFGGSWGEVEADLNTQKTDIESVFGGVYVSMLRGRTAIDAAVTLGYADFDRKRQVANNLVAGGIETARAGYDGFFISPEVTLTRPVWPGHTGQRVEASVTLRYAGLFLDGFTETGTAAPLTVNDRDIHVGVARFQLALPVESRGANGAVSRLTLKGGVEARTQFGGQTVSGALLGTAINFNPGSDDSTLGVFAGLAAEHISQRGATFYVSAEVRAEHDGSRQVSGKAGVKFAF